MNILILEDDSNRLEIFREKINPTWSIDEALTASQAIEFLKKDARYDLIFLSYDLGDQQMVESVDETGYWVAQKIAKNCKHLQKVSIVVHSRNPAGSLSILSELEGSGFEQVYKWPFNPDDLSEVVEALTTGEITHEQVKE
jgi:CheY-like chemotaxis protein